MKPETVRTIVLSVIAALIFAAGWLANGWRHSAEMSQLETEHARAESLAAKANAKTLAAANNRADALQSELSAWQQTLSAYAQEKTNEIARLATGRRCLDGALVRVLNQPTGGRLGGSVPQAAGGLVRPTTGTGADSDDGAFATDADIAAWANQCRHRYDTCRAHRDAIRSFYEGESGK